MEDLTECLVGPMARKLDIGLALKAGPFLLYSKSAFRSSEPILTTKLSRSENNLVF